MSSLADPVDNGGWEFPKPSPLAFADFMAELLELYQPPLRAVQSRDRMRFVLRLLSELVGPDGTTADLTPQLLARFVAARPDSEASITTHTLLACVRVSCNYAKSRGYLVMSPFDLRKRWVKVSVAPKKRHHSIEDIRRVLDTMRAEVAERSGWARWRSRRLLALASTVAYSGLRANEAIFLRVEDVDLENRMIRVVSHKGRRLKTDASAAPVPMPDGLVEILDEWLIHRADPSNGPYQRAPSDCPYLFPNVTGTNAWCSGLAADRPLGAMKAAGERAGVKGFTLHSLRHSFATHSEAWGIAPAMLQRILRHTSLSTQWNYRHADAENLRGAVGNVGFGDPPASPVEGGPNP